MIGIIDADLLANIEKHRFPNLACMKLSSYYKSVGEDVKLLLSYADIWFCEKVFVSKVFLDTEVPEEVLWNPKVEYGGTGFFYDKAIPLDYGIEHSKPDYELYLPWVNEQIKKGLNRKEFTYYLDYSIGFTTRGCIRQCKFCVNQNYKQVFLHSPVSEFMEESRKGICLLDDNILAFKNWKDIFDSLIETGKPFQYKQGLDERLLTEEKIDYVFNKSKWIGDFIFAFDNIKDKDIILKKLDMIRKGYNGKKKIKFYVFCGFNHEDPGVYTKEFWKQDILDLMERIKILRSNGCLPYIMRFKDNTLSPYAGMYVNVSRWCNQPSLCTKLTLQQFIDIDSESGAKASKRYIEKASKEIDGFSDYLNNEWLK